MSAGVSITFALFVWLTVTFVLFVYHQLAVFFLKRNQHQPLAIGQSVIFFSRNKSASATSQLNRLNVVSYQQKYDVADDLIKRKEKKRK
jgi:hypothetical protein